MLAEDFLDYFGQVHYASRQVVHLARKVPGMRRRGLFSILFCRPEPTVSEELTSALAEWHDPSMSLYPRLDEIPLGIAWMTETVSLARRVSLAFENRMKGLPDLETLPELEVALMAWRKLDTRNPLATLGLGTSAIPDASVS